MNFFIRIKKAKYLNYRKKHLSQIKILIHRYKPSIFFFHHLSSFATLPTTKVVTLSKPTQNLKLLVAKRIWLCLLLCHISLFSLSSNANTNTPLDAKDVKVITITFLLQNHEQLVNVFWNFLEAKTMIVLLQCGVLNKRMQCIAIANIVTLTTYPISIAKTKENYQFMVWFEQV